MFAEQFDDLVERLRRKLFEQRPHSCRRRRRREGQYVATLLQLAKRHTDDGADFGVRPKVKFVNGRQRRRLRIDS